MTGPSNVVSQEISGSFGKYGSLRQLGAIAPLPQTSSKHQMFYKTQVWGQFCQPDASTHWQVCTVTACELGKVPVSVLTLVDAQLPRKGDAEAM